MAQIQQSKPRIVHAAVNKSSFSTTKSLLISRSTIAIGCFLCVVACIMLVVNLQSMVFITGLKPKKADVNFETAPASTSTLSSSKEGDPHIRTRSQHHDIVLPLGYSSSKDLPLFDPTPMPPIHLTTHHPLNYSAMNEWASNPILGSYQYRLSGNQGHHQIHIHMPFQDLQSTYKGNPPQFGRTVGSGRMEIEPQGTHRQHFPDPDSVVLTRKGNKYSSSGVRANQDRIGISVLVDDGSSSSSPDFWMGLFDGHGDMGHVVSHYAIQEFPKRLWMQDGAIMSTATTLTSADTERIKTKLKDLFLEINRDIPNLVGSGSTGISMWKRKQHLFISNVGDSMAFVVSVEKQNNNHNNDNQNQKAIVEVIYTTKPHKPDDPVERHRIESIGGQVQEPPMPQYSWRVLIPMGGDPPTEVMALAMSRSLGDFEGHDYGIIAEPTTDVIDLSALDPSKEYLVIAATDGLLDRVSELEIAQQMAASRLVDPDGRYLALEAAEQLILRSSYEWMVDSNGGGYRDDISLAVRRLQI